MAKSSTKKNSKPPRPLRPGTKVFVVKMDELPWAGMGQHLPWVERGKVVRQLKDERYQIKLKYEPKMMSIRGVQLFRKVEDANIHAKWVCGEIIKAAAFRLQQLLQRDKEKSKR